MLTVGSLFSGIGGLDLGLERAGMRVVWQCESDPYARAVLRKHWPEVHCYGDVRTLRAPPAVDVLCGGFPCQDISNAGKRAGINGSRSGLWAEYARTIREVRPRYVLGENVAALLARGLERVVGDLAACGYDAEWDCIPAAAVGAHHRRDRLFIVAHAGLRGCSGSEILRQQQGRTKAFCNGEDVPDSAGVQLQGFASTRLDGFGCGGSRAVPDPNGSQREGGSLSGRVFSKHAYAGLYRWWEPEPDVGRVANGVPSRMDRLVCLGNAVVPQVAEYIGRLIVAHSEAT